MLTSSRSFSEHQTVEETEKALLELRSCLERNGYQEDAKLLDGVPAERVAESGLGHVQLVRELSSKLNKQNYNEIGKALLPILAYNPQYQEYMRAQLAAGQKKIEELASRENKVEKEKQAMKEEYARIAEREEKLKNENRAMLKELEKLRKQNAVKDQEIKRLKEQQADLERALTSFRNRETPLELADEHFKEGKDAIEGTEANKKREVLDSSWSFSNSSSSCSSASENTELQMGAESTSSSDGKWSGTRFADSNGGLMNTSEASNRKRKISSNAEEKEKSTSLKTSDPSVFDINALNQASHAQPMNKNKELTNVLAYLQELIQSVVRNSRTFNSNVVLENQSIPNQEPIPTYAEKFLTQEKQQESKRIVTETTSANMLTGTNIASSRSSGFLLESVAAIQNQLISRVPAELRGRFINAYSSKKLDLSNLYYIIDDHLIQYIIPFLNTNPMITILDVRHNQIGDAGAKALAGNQTLTSLDISWNQIGDVGAMVLAGNQTLTSLDVSWNQIGDAGATALAANRTLTTLNVSHNQIRDVGAMALAGNQTLTTLDVSWNQIGDASRNILLQAQQRRGR